MIGFMRFCFGESTNAVKPPPRCRMTERRCSPIVVAFASLQPSFAAPIRNRYKDLVPASNMPDHHSFLVLFSSSFPQAYFKYKYPSLFVFSFQLSSSS
jgi:hypothetical protein